MVNVIYILLQLNSALYCISTIPQSKIKGDVNKMFHFHLILEATRRVVLISDNFMQSGQAIAEILTPISWQIVEHGYKYIISLQCLAHLPVASSDAQDLIMSNLSLSQQNCLHYDFNAKEMTVLNKFNRVVVPRKCVFFSFMFVIKFADHCRCGYLSSPASSEIPL